MSLRVRLAAVAAVAVAVAVASASVLVYLTTRDQLTGQVDNTLRERMSDVRGAPVAGGPVVRPLLDRLPPTRFGAAGGYAQTITAAGRVFVPATSPQALPVTDAALAIAADGGAAFQTINVSGVPIRVLTSQWAPGIAVQVARPLDEVRSTLDRLRLVLILVTASAVVVAGGFGLVVSRAVLRPVHRLTETAVRVTETSDLTQRIHVDSRDELGRLATSFNTMLEALDHSLQVQRSLVADASHELRTPLTSIRTNIDVLRRADRLPPDEREQLTRDIDAQIADLAALVGDVIELARDGEAMEHAEDVRLDEVVARSVDQAALHWAGVEFVTDLEPTVVVGQAQRIARAVTNLLDNAGKWSPTGGVVTVGLLDGELAVTDEGPGVAPEDAPHVFDRFWRSPKARGLPGSGLGLAIVKQVADAHHATVAVDRGPSGGARFALAFPDATAPEHEEEGGRGGPPGGAAPPGSLPDAQVHLRLGTDTADPRGPAAVGPDADQETGPR